MRWLINTLVLLLLLSTPDVGAGEPFDWIVWRNLPVQNGGRQKPLDTLARETLRTIANRGRLVDPRAEEKLDPVASYLTLLLEWQGWDHPQRDQLQLVTDWRPLYFHLHSPDAWDQSPLLRVDYLPLRRAIGLAAQTAYVTPAHLGNVTVEDDPGQRTVPFSAWADELLTREAAGKELTELEKKGLELADHYWTYQNHRMGRSLEIIPIQGSEDHSWMPLAYLLLSNWDDTSDATGDLRIAQRLFMEIRAAFRQHDSSTFNRLSREFVETVRRIREADSNYQRSVKVDWEVLYNRWVPFRFAWGLMLLSTVGMWVHLGSRWRILYFVSFAPYVASLAAILMGFALRIIISGRPPVTNMYESVIYVGAGVTVFGLIFELIYRRKFVLMAASAVATVALVLADHCPLVLDPSMRPLEPVLRSNFWLTTHVLTITLSYAALALAWGIGNITLGYLLVGSKNETTISSLNRFTYKAVQVGVLLLAAGIILGGVWADYSWGRFWGWDPKEVWALIALLGYIAMLHARFVGWVGRRGLPVLSVGCFSLVVMAWYGVNFVLGAGLHSYGFGGGGQSYVYSAVVVQFLYIGAALWRATEFEDLPTTPPAGVGC